MTARNPRGLRRWAADLAMGARFAFAGGREGWARTALTALGVGLGVAVLLVAASIPHMTSARDAREDARQRHFSGQEVQPSDDSAVLVRNGTVYRGERVRGVLLQADGDSPPVPPGVQAFPAPGEMVASPALVELLASEEGELLRERLPWEISGTIGQAGLTDPYELAYYAGSDALEATESGERFERFGLELRRPGLDPVLVLLVIVGCVTLLLPVAAFVAAAVRFGGERRDRRLASLRLIGSDARMTRRVAAGEAAAGSLIGLVIGAAFFLLVRHLVDGFRVWRFSAFSSDITPQPLLAALLALAVPALAVLVSLLVLRKVAIEPLGVARHATGRSRRLWWRLIPPLTGAALLLLSDVGDGPTPTYRIAGGIVLVLVGVTALLPWLVEATARRLRGGRLPFQLAVRRLQLDSGTAARAVSGITVAVAGAVALQMLFAGVSARETESTGADPDRTQILVDVPAGSDAAPAAEVSRRLAATEGVRRVVEATRATGMTAGADPANATYTMLTIVECDHVAEFAKVRECRDGDVFVMAPGGSHRPQETAGPGTTLDLDVPGSAGPDGERAGKPVLWQVPEDAAQVPTRPGPSGSEAPGLLITPGALDIATLPAGFGHHEYFVELDPDVAFAVEHVRNTAASFGPAARAMEIRSEQRSDEFVAIEQALYVGATAVLLLVGASMGVGTLEQLRERKRLLSVLVAFGTRRSTLAWSVMWQTALPVVLGLALAAATGIGLGATLMQLARLPFAVDWAALGAMTGLGAALIALVTALSMPALWRLMRPDGLRTE